MSTEPEPTYHFKKGEGWVPCIYETYNFENRHGKWTLINRLPEIGETYGVFSDGAGYVKNGKVELEKFAAYIISTSCRNLLGWAVNRNGHLERLTSGDSVYCVIQFYPK